MLAERVPRIRRTYNKWVANETLEDYALRFTAYGVRRFSTSRIANTAIGAVSFLALEAIGGAITLNYGFYNAATAILVTCLLIFLAGIPISYNAARAGVDIDLLTRGAGFGYIGSTITSLIYASFTFIFFAIEAAILATSLELVFAIPPAATGRAARHWAQRGETWPPGCSTRSEPLTVVRRAVRRRPRSRGRSRSTRP